MSFPKNVTFLTALFCSLTACLGTVESDVTILSFSLTTSFSVDCARNGEESPNPGESRRDRC
jgi:hypothetical protein